LEKKAHDTEHGFIANMLGLSVWYNWRRRKHLDKRDRQLTALEKSIGRMNTWETRRNLRIDDIADRIDRCVFPYAEKVKDCANQIEEATKTLQELTRAGKTLLEKIGKVSAEGQRVGKLFGLVMDQKTRQNVEALKAELAAIQKEIKQRSAVVSTMTGRMQRSNKHASDWRAKKNGFLRIKNDLSRSGLVAPKREDLEQRAA